MSYELPNPPIFNWQNVEDRQLRYSLYELESYLYDLKNARTEDQKDLTTSSDKVFANLQLSSLTNNRLIGSNSVNTLVSVDLVDYIDGTTNQVTVTDDTDGTVTLSLPQDIDTGADVQFNSATLNDLDVDTLNLNGNVISDSTGTISFDNENLTTTGNITIDSDSSKLYLGDDQDLEIYHDGVDGYIDTQVGALKLNHNINGDVTLFQGTNPGDGNAGNKLKVYKYGKFLELYIDQWDNAIFQYGGGNIGIGSNNGTLNLQHNSEGNLSAFTNSVEGENRCFEQYGYISAASTKKYISWQVDDTDDYFHLSREDYSIKGFKIDMPMMQQMSGVGGTSYESLTLENIDAGTGVTSNYTPSLVFKANGWDGSASQQVKWYMYGDGHTNGNPTFFIKCVEDGEASKDILRIDSGGQFESEIKYAKHNAQEIYSQGFYLGNDANTTASYDQFSPVFRARGKAYNTVDESSDYCSFEFGEFPESGNPVTAVLGFRVGHNTPTPNQNFSQMRYDSIDLIYRQYGKIGGNSKYFEFGIKDSDDYIYLSREDSNILGFKVDMPLETTDITISSPSNIYNLSHDNFADYVANEHIDWTSASSENLVAKTLKGVPEMHPEVAGNFIIPYYANDIAFLVQKGGSVSFSGDTLPSNGHTGDTYLFNGKSNSVQWNNPTGDIIVEVTLDKTYNFGTNVGYSSTDAFRARSTKIEAYDGTGWFLVNEASGLTSGQHNIHFGAGSTGVTKLRFTFSDFVNASIFRVSQIWLINYSSSLGNSYFLSKGGGEVLGFIGIVTDTAESREAFSITQNDDDKAFIDYSGTIDSSTTKNITSYTSGNSIQGFVKVEINGSEKWMPYYDAPTS